MRKVKEGAKISADEGGVDWQAMSHTSTFLSLLRSAAILVDAILFAFPAVFAGPQDFMG